MSTRLSREEINQRLRAACDEAGGMRAWGRKHGVTGQYISDVLRGKREPGPAILKPLRMWKRVTVEYFAE